MMRETYGTGVSRVQPSPTPPHAIAGRESNGLGARGRSRASRWGSASAGPVRSTLVSRHTVKWPCLQCRASTAQGKQCARFDCRSLECSLNTVTRPTSPNHQAGYVQFLPLDSYLFTVAIPVVHMRNYDVGGGANDQSDMRNTRP